MLVLGRFVNQSIRIGTDIIITVAEVDRRNGLVRLGVIAPRDVPILRTELGPLSPDVNELRHEYDMGGES